MENIDELMDDAAKIILKLKDTLAERGARPQTPEKAVLWDEACFVYERMVRWANTVPNSTVRGAKAQPERPA